MPFMPRPRTHRYPRPKGLSLKGERLLEGNPPYPLVFCRNCGQEYLVAAWTRIKPPTCPARPLLSPFDAEVRYLRPGFWDMEKEPPPEDWQENGRSRKTSSPCCPRTRS
jgi:hypothetical protein